MKKKPLTTDQRQKRHQWRKKHKKSVNADRQRDTIARITKAAAALEGQRFSGKKKVTAALTEQCWQMDVIRPSYTTFLKYEHLWIHLVEGQSASTQNHQPSARTDETAVD